MSLYLQNDAGLFFGRKSVLVAEPDTKLSEHAPAYFPKKMITSLTSRCNLRCGHCMRGKCRDMGGQDMPREMIDHLVEVFFPRISCMQIGGIDFGEQMLSPHFGHFLRKAEEHGVGLDLVTNGTLINRDNANLLAASVTRALVSVEGAGPNYKKIRGVEWDRLRRNMALMLGARARSGRGEPLIACLNVCVIREFRDDCFALIDYSKEEGIDLLIFRNFIPNANGERAMSFLYYEDDHNEFYADIKSYAESRGVKAAVPPPIPVDRKRRSSFRRRPCSFPFEVFGMQADGRVVTCCLGGAFDLGTFSIGSDVMGMWRSEAYNGIRRTVNTASPPEPCRVCEAVNYNALAYRPSASYLLMKRIFTGSKMPGARRFKSAVKRARMIMRGTWAVEP